QQRLTALCLACLQSGKPDQEKLAGHNSIYKGNKRLMRRLRVLSDLQPLQHVGRIRRSRRIRQ
ncbi:hypothetical protein, partial [Escherichia coli]|uniref:hypothetical protein n=1 Tax=Escherichia coli TaxID=562 RepID=UPI001F4387BA